jgi:hypothetical protein
MSTSLPGQPKVDPTLETMPDPNWILFTIIKNHFHKGKGKIPQTVNMDSQGWWAGGNDPELRVLPLPEKVQRWGTGSSKRLHYSYHNVWIWSRDVITRWAVITEVMYILQQFAIKPTQDIQRIDYWTVSPWQEQDPVGGKMLFRAKFEVQILWVK